MKILKITGIILLVLIILMIAIPLLFTNQIAGIVKDQANKRLNATVDFKSVGLNLFENFPDLTLNINDLSIINNKKPFEGDTLMSMSQFEASVNIWSVIGGDQVKIESVNLQNPNIFIYVLEDNTTNYNIMKDTTVAAEEDTAAGDMSIALNNYSIKNGNIAYIDQVANMSVIIRNLNHSGSGDLSSEKFIFDTKTNIDEFTVEYGGVTYLNKVNTNLDMAIEADMASKRFTLRDNQLKLNNLILKFSGYAAMPDTESVSMDLTFKTERTDFKDIISLIPAVYSSDFDDLESSGKLNLTGYAKGLYTENRLPAFDLKLIVDNGRFQYPELPTPVNNVNVNLVVSNPGGSKDQTIIDLKNFHFELGTEPFNARLLVRNPVSTPYIETKVNGKIDLGKLRNALTLEDITKLEGIITADFSAKGKISSDKVKAAENINANGKINFSNIQYGSKDMAQDINVSNAQVTLSSQNINLNEFIMKIGESDLSAKGNLNNVFSYVLSNGIIRGNLSINSNYFNLNPFMSSEEKPSETDTSAKQLKAVELPGNVNFTMNAFFKQLVYDNLNLENVKGTIVLADSRLNLKGLNMNMLGGSLTADGYYYAPEGTTPGVSFNLSINDFNIKEAYKSFVTVQQFAPMANNIEGNFDAKITMASPLNSEMMPVWESFNASGNLNLEKAQINNFQPLNKTADVLNINELKNPVITNIKPSFKISNGRFYISPIDFKIMNYDVTFAGSNGMDNSIDYVMGIDIPAAKLKNQANKAISRLLNKDVDLITANKVEVSVIIKGRLNDPVISTSVSDIAEKTAQDIKSQVQEEVRKEVEEKKEEITKQVEEKADTLKDKLKKEAEKKIKDLFKLK